ncbi:MAG: hypothetical protein ACYDCQ_00940 [Dehalococcoidia bacterium]
MAADMMAPERARPHLEQQLRRIARLRATGPNPFDYFQWADESTSILRELFGADSDTVQAFRLAVADSGRTVDQRGIMDNMTLGLHGPWGIWARLDRAESVLRQLIGGA